MAATYVATNAEIKPSLGRDLGSCRGAATCNGDERRWATRQQAASSLSTRIEDRIQQLDLRFSRMFEFGRNRVRANFDIYNTFNASTILNDHTRYSNTNNTWLNVLQVMGGTRVQIQRPARFLRKRKKGDVKTQSSQSTPRNSLERVSTLS